MGRRNLIKISQIYDLRIRNTVFRKIERVDGPTRIFIGGVHGKEGLTTLELIKHINDDDVVNGKLLLYNCPESKYISTLDPLIITPQWGKNIKTYKNP